MATPQVAKSATQGRKITSLVLNILVPGIGSMYAGRDGEGWLQLLFLVVGLGTFLFLIGWAFIAFAWVWAVTSAALALKS